MMEKEDWVGLIKSMQSARELIEKGNSLEHEGYWHGIKWG